MKFTVISDTHGHHPKLSLLSGDVLIHAGDISKRGREDEIFNFLNWFSKQDFKYRIFTPGNHDFLFEEEPQKIKDLLPDEVIYLNDNSTCIEGIRIWGSPVTPRFNDWAFNRDPGDEIMKHWNLIPNDTDILITHGPAYSILDTTVCGYNVGCKDLLKRIQEVKPSYHICGHIHEAYGKAYSGKTCFINGSVLNEGYIVKNEPVRFELKR
jgi:Icc-related predicted phosphoesterase